MPGFLDLDRDRNLITIKFNLREKKKKDWYISPSEIRFASTEIHFPIRAATTVTRQIDIHLQVVSFFLSIRIFVLRFTSLKTIYTIAKENMHACSLSRIKVNIIHF